MNPPVTKTKCRSCGDLNVPLQKNGLCHRCNHPSVLYDDFIPLKPTFNGCGQLCDKDHDPDAYITLPDDTE